MSDQNSPQPIQVPSTSEVPPPPSASSGGNSLAYGITAFIFFGLGFVVAGLLGVDILNTDDAPTTQAQIAQGVQATFQALTPPPTVAPTAVPIPLTYSDRDHILGSQAPDAPITLVEFSDYQCPWCGVFAQETLPGLLDRYDGYVRFVYRDYPIFGPDSLRAAHAAACAAEQSAFQDYHFALFGTQSRQPPLALDENTFLMLADDLSLDAEAFRVCLAQERILQDIAQNFQDAQALFGGRGVGTPTFLLNGKYFQGAASYQTFVERIDAELEALGIEPPA